ELDLAAAREQFGMPYVIFRPHNVYGAHQNLGDPYRNVLGIFMSQAMEGRPLTIFGDGEQVRAFTHVDDVAPHIARSVHVQEPYNRAITIGADEPYSVNQLARLTLETFGVNLPIHHLPARNEVYHVYASHEKARRLLNVAPTVSLEDGVRRMA